MYVWLLDGLERVVLTERQVAAFAVVMGADTEMPDWLEIRRQFDESLESPKVISAQEAEHAERLRLLGLRGRG